MPLNGREEQLFYEIREWEDKLYKQEANDFQLAYDRYLEKTFALLPESTRQYFFSSLDNWLFHLHSFISGSQLQLEAKERILTSGRIFRSEITSIEDMKTLSIEQLQYIAEQQIARHRLYSFLQGSISGTGGTILLSSDIPGMAVINLRIVQLIAMTYGVEVNTPFEIMTALKVFNVATLPARLQSQGWEELMNEVKHAEERYFYEGSEDITNLAWFEQLLKQGVKGLTIILFRKKLLQGIPFISMAVGAGVNYRITRRVSDFAHRYYQMRYLLEKKRDEVFDEQ
jgi:hypothetical protein